MSTAILMLILSKANQTPALPPRWVPISHVVYERGKGMGPRK
jgi:hypothetical protein